MMKATTIRCMLVSGLFLLAGHGHAQVPTDVGPGDLDPSAMQAVQAAGQAWYTRSAQELAATGKAREQAFAALLLEAANWKPPMDAQADDGRPSQPAPSDPRIARRRALAAAHAGNDVIANALLVSSMDESVRRQAAARWRASEPDNLAPLLWQGLDGDALLTAARGSTRFDLHYFEKLRWMQRALLSHPPTPAELAVLNQGSEAPVAEIATMTAMGIDTAIMMPGLKPLSAVCKKDAIAGSMQRSEDCRQLGLLLRDHSDTQLGVTLGFGLLSRLASTPAEQADADAHRRDFDWRMQQWLALTAKQPRDGIPDFLRLFNDPSITSEPRMINRLLQENGIPLQPPAGWQPQPYGQPQQRRP